MVDGECVVFLGRGYVLPALPLGCVGSGRKQGLYPTHYLTDLCSNPKSTFMGWGHPGQVTPPVPQFLICTKEIRLLTSQEAPVQAPSTVLGVL